MHGWPTHAHACTHNHTTPQSLETWVHEWREVVLSDVGAAALQGRTEGVHVLPVFVFDAAGAGEAGGCGSF